ncbi:MAG: polysaccharide deacetylase family protein [Aquaticitalea sp.]
MNLVPVKTPAFVKRLFSSYVWDFKTTEKILYLTFDDGPTQEITDWTLDVLSKHNAKATFFCIGNNIIKHPDVFRRIEEEGHTIGNHTYNHPYGWRTKVDDYVLEVQKTQNSIDSEMKNYNSKTINYFRPPYGQITPRQGRTLQSLGYRIVMWDVLAFDWMDTVSPEECYHNIIRKATSGSIIVFHDSVKASVNMQYALPKVLDYFSEKGFEFRRIPV